MGDMKFRQQTATEMIQALFRGYGHENLLTNEILKEHVKWAIQQDKAILEKVFASENHPSGPQGMPYQPNFEGLKFLAKKLSGDAREYAEYPRHEYEGSDCRSCNGWEDVYDFVWKPNGKPNKLGEPIGYWAFECTGICKACADGDAVPSEALQAILDQYPHLPARTILLEIMIQQISKLFSPALMKPDDLKTGLNIMAGDSLKRIQEKPYAHLGPPPYGENPPGDEDVPF